MSKKDPYMVVGPNGLISDILSDFSTESEGDTDVETQEITASQFENSSQFMFPTPRVPSRVPSELVQRSIGSSSKEMDISQPNDSAETLIAPSKQDNPPEAIALDENESASKPAIGSQAPKDHYDAYADQYVKFMNTNPTTFHTVRHFKSLLSNNNFTELDPRSPIKDLKPGFYYIARDDLTLVAFGIGGKWTEANGAAFIGTHVDALAIKVNSGGTGPSVGTKDGYERLGVAPYSGALGKDWLNRDLGVAGAVLVRDTLTKKVKRKLINSAPKVIGAVPILAEHFGSVAESSYDLQTQMVPIVGTTKSSGANLERTHSAVAARYPSAFLKYVARLADAKTEDILNLDLDLFDVQPAARGGLDNEFIYSSALDDRLCSFSAIYALIEFSQRFLTEDITDFDGVVGVYAANHEEIGSGSRTGAKSGLLREVLTALATSADAQLQLFANTVIVSSDVTHAVNPNFHDIYLEDHMPVPNTGPTIKIDANMHVLSDSPGWAFAENIVTKHCSRDMSLQVFHIRNDSRSGGTIGPIMSEAQRGINGARAIVDIGMPILSMHSVRSMCGYKDIGLAVDFYKAVFTHWRQELIL
ncbi:vacuolar aminopeptidase 1 [Diutina catenulata]